MAGFPAQFGVFYQKRFPFVISTFTFTFISHDMVCCLYCHLLTKYSLSSQNHLMEMHLLVFLFFAFSKDLLYIAMETRLIPLLLGETEATEE